MSTAKNNSELISSVVQQLANAVVYSEGSNLDTNKKLWNEYSKDWDPQQDWVEQMFNYNRPYHQYQTQEDDFPRCLGDEWSDAHSLRQVLEEFLFPFLEGEKVVGEIGSGGGRIAVRVAPRVKELWCFDIAEEMLKRCKSVIYANNNSSSNNNNNNNNNNHVHFGKLTSNELPPSFDSYFDVLYCFDVLVHVDLHSQWQWLNSISRALKPGGLCFLSTADVTTEGGWLRFSKQKKYSAGGFYFISPQIVEKLVSGTDFEFIKRSKPDPSNQYYNRDFLFVLKKKVKE